MPYFRIVLACVMAATTSTMAIALLYRYAQPLGLVDRPDDRKRHVGNIPLIGGLSAFFGVLVGACIYGGFSLFTNVLLGTATVLALVGALDDRFDLSVRARLLVQTAAVLTMVATTGLYIHTLGHIFGHEIDLGVLGIPVTVVAVIGLLNAFNMMDGIDGLAGSLALVSIGAIIMFDASLQWHRVILLVLLMAALIPYLAANLGLVGRKIFLGDAGSMMVGYLLAWNLIRLSQQSSLDSQLSSVDVLWCVALPVLDTLAVMARRLREGKSPFKPDRGHIHHLLLNSGLGPRTTLVALVALAVTLAFVGTLTGALAPGSNLLAFSMLAVTYVTVVNRAWHRQQGRQASAQPQPAAGSMLRGTLSATVVQFKPHLHLPTLHLPTYPPPREAPKRGTGGE